jgi:hypothetical protein
MAISNTEWEYERGLRYVNEDLEPKSLENELVQFIENNSNAFDDTDTDRTQSTKIKRYVIRYFALIDSPGCGHYLYFPRGRPGLVNIATKILTFIANNSFKTGEIVSSNQLILCLSRFNVCVELIDTFLDRFIETEIYNTGAKPFMRMIKQSVLPSSLQYLNIHQLCQRKINRYHIQVLNLWVEVLIRENKIPKDILDETRRIVTTKEQYETLYRRLLGEIGGGYTINSNLPESVLLKWLALIYIGNIVDIHKEVLLKSFNNGGIANTLDGVIFGIISQFVGINDKYNYRYIPQSDKHNSELNELMLVCNNLMQDPSSTPPVRAYLSSEVLDECVISLSGRFPTEQEFIQFINTRRIQKVYSPPPPASTPPASAPELSELDGGKKTKRNHKKKYKKYKINKRKTIKK